MAPKPEEITIKRLGTCNEPDCTGKCFFYPEGEITEKQKNSCEILKFICVGCGHAGALHVIPLPAPATASAPQEPPEPPGLHRPNPTSSGPQQQSQQEDVSFQNTFRARKAREQAQMGQDFQNGESNKSEPFHPATHLHKNSFNPETVNRKKGTQPGLRPVPQETKKKSSKSKSDSNKASKTPSSKAPQGNDAPKPGGKTAVWRFVLLNDTEKLYQTLDADGGKYLVPKHERFMRLRGAGLVQEVALNTTADATAVTAAVKSAFEEATAFSIASLENWQLLRRAAGSKSQGSRSPLVVYSRPAGGYTGLDLSMCRTNTPPPARISNVIYIALDCGNPDLEVEADTTDNENKSDTDADEPTSKKRSGSESDTLSESPATKKRKTASGDGWGSENSDNKPSADKDDNSAGDSDTSSKGFATFANDPDVEEHNERTESKEQAQHEEPETFNPNDVEPESQIPGMWRLYVNITEPNSTAVPQSQEKSQAQAYWAKPSHGTERWYSELNTTTTLLLEYFQKMEYFKPEAWATWPSIRDSFKDLVQDLNGPFDFLEEVRYSLYRGEDDLDNTASTTHTDLFAERVRFGELGLAPFIEFIHVLYESAIEAWYLNLDSYMHRSQIAFAIDQLNTFGDALFSLIYEYRRRFQRHHFDPPGFAELQNAIRTGLDAFPIASRSDFSYVRDINVFKNTPSFSIDSIKMALALDFGSSSNRSLIRAASLRFGVHGIHGFVSKTIIPLLDQVPLKSRQYYPLMSLLRPFCSELAQKIISAKKSQYSARTRTKRTQEQSDSVGEDKEEDKRKEGYQTRNKKAKTSEGSCQDSETKDNERSKTSPPCYEYTPDDQERSKFSTGNTSLSKGDNSNTKESSRPKPRPLAKIDTRTDLQKEVDALNKTCNSIALGQGPNVKRTITKLLVKQYFNPNHDPQTQARYSWKALRKLQPAQRWREAQKIFHADRNVSENKSERWATLSQVCSQILNDKCKASSSEPNNEIVTSDNEYGP